MGHIEDFPRVLEFNFDIFEYSVGEVVGYFEFGNKGLIKKKQPHSDEQIAVSFAKIDRLVDLPQSTIAYITKQLLLKVG